MQLLIKSIKLCWLLLLVTSLNVQQVIAEEVTDSWAKPIDKSFNFYQVTPSIYRSAMPDQRKLKIIQAQHISTVISLIKEDDKQWLGDKTNINYISYPIHADRVTDDDVLYILRTIKQSLSKGEAVLLHCKHGQNRTGLFVAMYRIVNQRWTKQHAIWEMANGGYSTDLNDIKDAIAYIKKAKVRKIRYALQYDKCSTHRLAFCHLFE